MNRVDCSQSPIFPWDRRCRSLSSTSRHLGLPIRAKLGGVDERNRHYPRAFCTLPSYARIERPRWRPVELNDRHLRSHGKIGDCEQSISRVDSLVPLIHHDPRDLGLISLIKKLKIRFRILSDLRIQSWIFLKKRTLNLAYGKAGPKGACSQRQLAIITRGDSCTCKLTSQDRHRFNCNFPSNFRGLRTFARKFSTR